MAQAPRIDLNHGYMRFIRRNQLDRDEFDRVHERRKSEIRERIAEKNTKPSNLYIPPHLRQKKIEDCRSLSRSDSDTQEQEEDEKQRNQIRQRIERTHATVDDICLSLANYSLEDGDRSDKKLGNEELFTLELTLQSGERKKINVSRNTQAARLAKCISREHDFDDSQCRNLRIFIEEQLEMRISVLYSHVFHVIFTLVDEFAVRVGLWDVSKLMDLFTKAEKKEKKIGEYSD
uniref:Uncharacterized protein n=1 Tax=Caenorhabditis japonica TaxID=281687 RepID=A0A8R1DYZ8_CAEJA